MNRKITLRSIPWKRSLLLLGLLLVLLALLASMLADPAQAQSGDGSTVYLPMILGGEGGAVITPTPPAFVPQSVFGLNTGSLAGGDGLAEVLNAGASWIHASQSVRWAEVEPVKGERRWEALADLEAELQAAANRGLRVILTVEDTPDWASVPGSACGQPLPEHRQALVAFLRDLVQRYGAPPFQVKHWELWSEQDTYGGCWSEPSEPSYAAGGYAAILSLVYPQIKAVDPEAQLLLGSLRLECDPLDPPGGKDCSGSSFLESFLQAGGGASFDGVSFQAADGFAVYDLPWGAAYQFSNYNWHSYWHTGGPSVIAKAGYIRRLLEEYRAGDKALYNTQSAVLCASCESVPVFETAKAGYVAQVYAAAAALDLEANLWQSLTGWQNSGLVDQDFTPRPAYQAYQFAREKIGPAAYTGEILPADVGGVSGVRGCKFTHADGRPVWLLWYVSLSEPSHAVAFTPQPQAAWDVLGNSLAVGGELEIGVDPVYVEWAPSPSEGSKAR